ncbi:MAG: MFS transporter [Proteobacteria bacterium]|nr:MFS transporter [Pseudomonadota bacterium]MBU1686446.1 MFS transporter [Pseudomonadota bacterium]
MKRNLLILTTSQALGMAAAPMIVLIGGIIGQELSPDVSKSTLPIAAMVVGGAACSAPAALLMGRVGRRNGFMAGSLLSLISSLVAYHAITISSFPLFCLGTFGIGANMAFIQQYRFAAVESVTSDLVGRAVSFVLLGGIVAAFLGPEIAKHTRDFIVAKPYAGSFIALAGLSSLNILILSLLKFPPSLTDQTRGPGHTGRKLSEIISQPLFITAILSGLVAYAGMTLIMTATPVSMRLIDGYSLGDTAWVIQSHVMAMFIPSLFSGLLIDRIGLRRVMLGGIVLMATCGIIAQINHQLIHYWLGLVMLGVGWNFLFVGGTALLTRSYRPAERFRAQGVNDLIVYSGQAAASFLAGALIFTSGWQFVNLIILPMLLVITVVIFKMGAVINHK